MGKRLTAVTRARLTLGYILHSFVGLSAAVSVYADFNNSCVTHRLHPFHLHPFCQLSHLYGDHKPNYQERNTDKCASFQKGIEEPYAESDLNRTLDDDE